MNQPTSTTVAVLLSGRRGQRIDLELAPTKRIGGLAAPIVAAAPRRRTGLSQAPDPQGASVAPQTTTRTASRAAFALNIPAGERREHQLDALWALSPAERVEAMWRGDLTLFQLTRWSSRAQHEVPLLGGEFAYIVMRTPEWAEAADEHRHNVIRLPERSEDRAAA